MIRRRLGDVSEPAPVERVDSDVKTDNSRGYRAIIDNYSNDNENDNSNHHNSNNSNNSYDSNNINNTYNSIMSCQGIVRDAASARRVPWTLELPSGSGDIMYVVRIML